MTSIPYQFIKQGNLLIVPVGPSISDVPYPNQSFTNPPDYSLWIHGKIRDPGPDLDHARSTPRLYQEVRDDLVRYSPVEVTRSALRRSLNQHAYVGIIDSRGTPYYFAFDSRGLSVREADPNDERVWKTFDLLADGERAAALTQRRADASAEMVQIDRELSTPALVVTKGLRYGKKTEWKHDAPHATWWRKLRPRRQPKDKVAKQPKQTQPKETKQAKPKASNEELNVWRAKYPGGSVEAMLEHAKSLIDLVVLNKALPRKSREQEVKKTPSGKASKKRAGATGRTRYTYPQERQNKGVGKPASPQVPLVVEHDDARHADPAELANQLGVSIRTLSRVARKLGRDEFSKFMRSHLKRFAAKHRLDPDYWGTLYTNIAADPGGVMVKSDDDAWKQFGHNVNATARSVPEGHSERMGDRKVFIHHVHHEMKQRGLYHGSLDEFKNHLVHAHKQGHVVLSRADFVQAMDPHSVKQSNTKASGATFNFVNNVKHVPEQTKKPEPKQSEPGSAHEASQRANAATAHAEQAKTPEAHLAAMTAHHQAGAAHQKATGKISNKASLRHFSQSITHLNASKAKT